MISLAAKASRHGRTLGHPDLKRIPSHRIQSAQWPTLEDANRIFWKGGKAATVQPSPTRVFDRVPFLGGFEWGSVTRKPSFFRAALFEAEPSHWGPKREAVLGLRMGHGLVACKARFPQTQLGDLPGVDHIYELGWSSQKVGGRPSQRPNIPAGAEKKTWVCQNWRWYPKMASLVLFVSPFKTARGSHMDV